MIPWRLMVVTDRALAGGDERLLSILEAAARAGGPELAVQLREKDLAPEATRALARRVRERIAPHGASLIVNRLAIEGAGLHLPAGDPPPRDRNAVAVEPYGRSTHSVSEVEPLRDEKPDYLVFGPLFPTRGKPEGLGLEALRAACVASGEVPVIAIGGIGPEQARAARAAGAHGVAVIRAVLEAADPAAATTALLLALH